ncbi:hypothetical protein AALP_AA6G037200 [Arabis alpina]|uniref:Uncharacterized protein n=1 Tax=Arabis alpina TaxID=50452 RepID=A0A087GLX3_ARAAL|nr:hypothetical protein AALP_AA6G037200 [Arabis alpina]
MIVMYRELGIVDTLKTQNKDSKTSTTLSQTTKRQERNVCGSNRQQFQNTETILKVTLCNN